MPAVHAQETFFTSTSSLQPCDSLGLSSLRLLPAVDRILAYPASLNVVTVALTVQWMCAPATSRNVGVNDTQARTCQRLLTDKKQTKSTECIPGTLCWTWTCHRSNVSIGRVIPLTRLLDPLVPLLVRMFPTPRLGVGRWVIDPKRGVEWSADHV